MAKVHFVKKAQKDYPQHNIAKGEPYYWWQLFKQSKQFSKTPPKRSQLTGSAFLSQLWDLEDGLADRSFTEKEDVEELVSDLESLRDECQDSLDNMPEGLQENSESGQLLQERIEALDEWIGELENLSYEYDELDDEELSESQKEEKREELADQVQSLTPSIS